MNSALLTKEKFVRNSTIINAAWSIFGVLLAILSFIVEGNTITKVLLLFTCLIVSLIISFVHFRWGNFNWSKTDTGIMVFIPIFTGIIVMGLYYLYSYNNTDARYIAPSLRQPLKILPYVYTYNTNARVKDHIYETSKNSLDPAKYFLRLEFVMLL